MKSVAFFAITVAATMTAFTFHSATAQVSPPAPLKGTVCYSKTLRPSDGLPISCPGIGKFATVAEIYTAGYRVVSSGVFQEAGGSTIFLIIEERK